MRLRVRAPARDSVGQGRPTVGVMDGEPGPVGLLPDPGLQRVAVADRGGEPGPSRVSARGSPCQGRPPPRRPAPGRRARAPGRRGALPPARPPGRGGGGCCRGRRPRSGWSGRWGPSRSSGGRARPRRASGSAGAQPRRDAGLREALAGDVEGRRRLHHQLARAEAAQGAGQQQPAALADVVQGGARTRTSWGRSGRAKRASCHMQQPTKIRAQLGVLHQREDLVAEESDVEHHRRDGVLPQVGDAPVARRVGIGRDGRRLDDGLAPSDPARDAPRRPFGPERGRGRTGRQARGRPQRPARARGGRRWSACRRPARRAAATDRDPPAAPAALRSRRTPGPRPQAGPNAPRPRRRRHPRNGGASWTLRPESRSRRPGRGRHGADGSAKTRADEEGWASRPRPIEVPPG